MTEAKLKKLLQRATSEFKVYLNPHFKPGTFHIDPAAVDMLSLFMPDMLDAMNAIARLADECYPRLTWFIATGSIAGQVEFHLTGPATGTIHFLLFERVVYCSTYPLLPYE